MGLSLYATIPFRTDLDPAEPGTSAEDRDWDARHVASPSYGHFNVLRAQVAAFYGIEPYRKPRGRRHPSPVVAAFWHHSDCEGEWNAYECGQIARLLYPYVEAGYDDQDGMAGHILEGCEAMAQRGGAIHFS